MKFRTVVPSVSHVTLCSQPMIKLTVNNLAVTVNKGATLLDAINAAKCHVPTLCFNPRLPAHAVCRMCLVDVKNSPRPMPACATLAKEGDVVETHTEALKRFRRADLELLLARHPNECMRCEVSGSCKLQSLVQEEHVEEKWPKVIRGVALSPSHHPPRLDGASHATPHNVEPAHVLHDHTSPAIARDIDKCIECGLCVQACGADGQNINVIGFVERGSKRTPMTIFDRPLKETDCISCGQCTAVCPVGALTERSEWQDVLHILDERKRVTVVQTAPATRIAIGEEFGLPPGAISTGRLCNALRLLGFDYVFDTNFAADVTIMEEASELLHRMQGGGGALPMFTSCCPGWINFVELNRPDLLKHLSTTKSPQQIHGALTKRGLFPSKLGPEFANGKLEPYVVSIMPCTAKKDEARRPSMSGDVDAVLTTRELARMLRARRIPFASLPNDGQFGNRQ